MGHPETGDAIAQLEEILEYDAIGGKRHRGLTVLAIRELVEPRKQDTESLQWALTDAINDATLMGACIYRLLKLYCREQLYYLNLIELFLQSSYQTEIGQTLDLITAPQGNVDLGRFTERRYKSIEKYKIAFYSFYLPVATVMYMVRIDYEKERANTKKIMLEMGEFFQIQDDYLDLFGDPSVTHKFGTDIQDNKFCWLVVQCLQWATPEQYEILKENSGRRRPRRWPG
ncbi:hypothetical protein EGM_13410 [Macaca fascicularis]|uniref:Farnesyl pyrophosphate synthase n=1 Tax=Macaca fascicularis TaxID=9541 RepID=G7P4L3_MACFA|nr:hypothetical protein EGM_13410 [Macaca fascicularis]